LLTAHTNDSQLIDITTAAKKDIIHIRLVDCGERINVRSLPHRARPVNSIAIRMPVQRSIPIAINKNAVDQMTRWQTSSNAGTAANCRQKSGNTPHAK
jgi:hypothetical protein